MEEIHKAVGEIHKPVGEIHKPVREIHKPVREIYKAVGEIHKAVECLGWNVRRGCCHFYCRNLSCIFFKTCW